MIDHAFTSEIHDRHGLALFRFARTLTLGDSYAAEDIVQETLVRAWRHAKRLDTAPAELRPWLFTVVRRLAIDGHRARRARPAEIEEDDMLTRPVPDGTDHTLDRQIVREALLTLEPQHRDVLVYRYLLDLSVEETAAELHIPTGTVKSRSSKALRALRAVLTIDG
ncbi:MULTISPECIES: sigma-70 family RNA polymerase sigma factor [Actinoplanes]|uniref:sigma-70 family RNA polymerase sigma factor n=1 Tax=Actinoplanes TaxID=1865 RepID=UPI0005F28138|nr:MULTISPECIES: sigma-70 family RNA polymerase sigma factor [Actinoplanes]GLY00681.1 RNA polymerase sigma factor [Actinoplanes sp. NBRC 101535]